MLPDQPTVEATTVLEPPVAGSRKGGATLIWALIGCALLGISGVVRVIQERRHQFEKSQKEACPIAMDKFPDRLGDHWKLISGGDRKLDEYTMRIAGGTDHFIKTYANEMTGVVVTILVLFGPADPVLPHSPQVCYPATGFSPGDPPTPRAVSYTIGKDDQGHPIERQAEFLSASYLKPNGRQVIREAVYHSYRLDGLWSPSIGVGRKFPRRNPGIFKVQIQRRIAEAEKLDRGDPLEQFLSIFLTELEAEIKAAATTVVETKVAAAR